MSKRALVTGITGFVGPYLAEELRRSGFEVWGFARKGKKEESILQGDILDRESLQEAFTEAKPDVVIHLAGFSSVRKSFDERERVLEVNVEGTKNLLYSAESMQVVPRVLIVSSGEVYGNPQVLPTSEEHPRTPLSPYAESRVQQEDLITSRAEFVTVARSFNHTGPGQPDEFVLPSFAKQIAEIHTDESESTIKVGNLAVWRDFLDVRDVVKAYVALIEKDTAGEIFNVSSGKSYSISHLLGELIRISGKAVRPVVDPERMRPADIPVTIGDHAKITEATRWEPTISMEETLRDLYEFAEKNAN